MEQKKFDVNSFIGMILIGGIIFWWMSTQEPEVDATTNTTTTSKVADAPETINNTVTAAAFENDSLKQINLQNKLGAFAQSAISASNGVSVLENEVVKLL